MLHRKREENYEMLCFVGFYTMTRMGRKRTMRRRFCGVPTRTWTRYWPELVEMPEMVEAPETMGPEGVETSKVEGEGLRQKEKNKHA